MQAKGLCNQYYCVGGWKTSLSYCSNLPANKGKFTVPLETICTFACTILCLYQSCLPWNDRRTTVVDENRGKDESHGLWIAVICRKKVVVNVAIVWFKYCLLSPNSFCVNIVSKAPTADLAMTTLTENVSQRIFVSRIMIIADGLLLPLSHS